MEKRNVLKFIILFIMGLMYIKANGAIIYVTATHNPDSNKVINAINGAASGDTVVIGEGTYYEVTSTPYQWAGLTLTGKKITLVADPSAKTKPSIHLKNITLAGDGSGIILKGLHLVVRYYSNGDYFFDFATSVTNAKYIKVYDCVVDSAVRGIRTNRTGSSPKLFSIDTVIFKNMIWNHKLGTRTFSAGYPAISFDNVRVKYFLMQNSTVYNLNGILFRIKNAFSNPSADTTKFIVDHCTFFKTVGWNGLFLDVASGGTDSSGAAAYPKIYLTNNIISVFKDTSEYTTGNPKPFRATLTTASIVMANNCFYNYSVGQASNIMYNWNTFSGCTILRLNNIVADPGFVDTLNANFTVTNTALYTAGTNGDPIGDPRWIPNRYWIPNGITGSINDGTNWAVTSNGLPIAGTLWWNGNYNAIFDANSGTANVTLDNDYTIKSLSTTGATTVNLSGAKKLTISNDLSVGSSGVISIDAATSVDVIGKVTVDGTLTNNGVFTLKSSAGKQATLISAGTVGGTGTYNVEQYLTGSGGATPDGRYWYISSPVASATSNVFAPSASSRLWSWSESGQAYTSITDNLTALVPLTGYVSRLGANQTVTFTGGALNTGNLNIATTNSGGTFTGFNLVGNPYPSCLDWEQVSAASTNIWPTMWYRTYNTAGSVMVFDAYNATSHIGTNNNGEGAVTQYIPPMQGYWVYSTAAGTLNTTNAMRSHPSNNLLKSAAATNNKIVRIVASNGNKSDEAIVYFNSEASDGYDVYDSPKMFANVEGLPEIYSIVENKYVVMNGLKSVTGNKSVALGFTTKVAGKYTITAKEISGFESDQPVMLKDNLLNVVTDLRQGGYTFNAAAENTTGRFSLLFAAEPTMISQAETPDVLIYASNGKIMVVLDESIVANGEVSVTNLLGQEIIRQEIRSNVTEIKGRLQTGVYIVNVRNGKSVTTKKINL
jgi:hypothetical protein